jgi:signal transduction histidine kinase
MAMSEIVVSSEAVRGRSSWVVREGRIRYLLGVAVLSGLYYGAAKVGFLLEFAGPVAAIVWLPVGVGIAFLFLGGLRFWPGVLIGDLLANDYGALPLGSALGQTCGNMLEVLVAVVLLRRLLRGRSPLASVWGVGCMLIAIVVGTAVSATIGALSLRLGGVISNGAIPKVWRTWWLGDATGALVVVPLALAWYHPRDWRIRRPVEAVILLAAVVALSELVMSSSRPLSYVLFPALLWAALRFGPRGGTLAVAITAGVTVWNTTHYLGPFYFHSITRSVLITQLFIGVAALSTLCLAVVVSEREAFASGLRASRARLVDAAYAERRRIERNLHDGAQQRLTAVAYRLHEAGKELQRAPEVGASLIEGAEEELQLAIDELRELAHGIHPPALTTFGLAKAIPMVAARSTVPVELDDVPSRRFAGATEAAAYYVIVEAIANTQKYAHASRIRVRCAAVRDVIEVEIVDDGIGGAKESVGSGLEGLRDRIEAIGGTFELDSPPGRGTRITATIPATATAV